jgi:hypothetical protein
MAEKINLPPRQYFTLTQAAKELGCDIEDLLHLGTTERLELIVKIPSNISVECLYENVDEQIQDFFSVRFMSLFAYEIANFEDNEQGKLSLDAVGGRDFWGNEFSIENIGKFYKLQYDRDCFFYDFEEKVPIEVIATRKDIYMPQQEMERLKNGVPISENQAESFNTRSKTRNQAEPHGNQERFAINRERVLKVAIACKNNYQHECTTQADWARTIDQKWRLFYPEELEPPLKPSSIESLLSDALKIPD